MQNNITAGIKFSDTTGAVCGECKNNTFTEVLLLRKVSKFAPGNVSGMDQVIPVPVFACAKCNHVNKEFLPEALKDDDYEDATVIDD